MPEMKKRNNVKKSEATSSYCQRRRKLKKLCLKAAWREEGNPSVKHTS